LHFADMVDPLSRGYAVAAPDTGHSGGMADWSFPVHREKFIDFGYRAIHEMTVKSKAVVEAHYGTAATRSYWNGCSSGGRQGLTTAHRFPQDYDGVIARAPAIKLAFQTIRLIVVQQATTDPVEPVVAGSGVRAACRDDSSLRLRYAAVLRDAS
jgi:Tannase and feruloyl esterase